MPFGDPCGEEHREDGRNPHERHPHVRLFDDQPHRDSNNQGGACDMNEWISVPEVHEEERHRDDSENHTHLGWLEGTDTRQPQPTTQRS